MKEIRITLDDKEHKELMKKKGELSWHDYLCAKVKVE